MPEADPGLSGLPAEEMPAAALDPGNVILSLGKVVKHFRIRGGMLQPSRVVHALDGVTLEVKAGETLGIVGESGSGKTTLARIMVGLEEPTSGTVAANVDQSTASKGPTPAVGGAAEAQMVFQDPTGSLDPRMTIGASVGEPLSREKRTFRRNRVQQMLDLVGLEPGTSNRYPHQLSGGQQQRACIARALIGGTKLVIYDEALSSLDVSLQAQIIGLLEELQAKLGLTYVFISHDLTVVESIATRTGVMYLGKMVELGRSEDVRLNPLHPYTLALRSAVPVPNPEVERRRQRIILHGEVGSSIKPPTGCRFHPRCPLAEQICREEEPEFVEYQPGQWSACHFSNTWSEHPTGHPQSLQQRVSAR